MLQLAITCVIGVMPPVTVSYKKWTTLLVAAIPVSPELETAMAPGCTDEVPCLCFTFLPCSSNASLHFLCSLICYQCLSLFSISWSYLTTPFNI